jgi:hypothetical protein
VLRRMGHVLDARRVVGAIAEEGRDEIRAMSLVTLGLVAGPVEEDVAKMMVTTAKTATGAALRHAAVFALGMTDHERLRALARDEPTFAGPVGWWRSLGPAIHDDDVLASA